MPSVFNSLLFLLAAVGLLGISASAFAVVHTVGASSHNCQSHLRFQPQRIASHPVRRSMVSGGFTYEDDEQIQVSVQKPIGLVFEQDQNGIIRVDMVVPNSPAAYAGIRVGDILLSVQNVSTEQVYLDGVLQFIHNEAPNIVNLRFYRGGGGGGEGDFRVLEG